MLVAYFEACKVDALLDLSSTRRELYPYADLEAFVLV